MRAGLAREACDGELSRLEAAQAVAAPIVVRAAEVRQKSRPSSLAARVDPRYGARGPDRVGVAEARLELASWQGRRSSLA